MKILYVIPARGGSKGIPYKNIKPLNGKPIIYYTIDVARQLTTDDHICISTDDDRIIEVVEDYGLKVPFKRPTYLATDTAGSYDVLLHTLSYYNSIGYEPDTIIMLQPNNASVIEAMKKLNEVPGSLTLFAVNEQEQLVGTLTDGDIRRGFIHGLTLNDSVEKFMLKSFHKVRNGFSVHDFKEARDKGIRLLPVLNETGQIEKVYDLKKRKSILPLEAMIMAGGRGERLRPLTDKTPKPMLPLGNKPIIEHNIDRLISYGIEKIYISV